MIHYKQNGKTITPEEKFLILTLSRIEGIGPRRYISLCNKFNDFDAIFRAPFPLLAKYLGDKIASEIHKGQVLEQTKDFVSFLSKNNIGFVTIAEPDYPAILKEIYDPPIVLYYCGDFKVNDFDRCLSVVGTRLSTDYGNRICEKIVADLVDAGFTIISGMAYGIDLQAHETAVRQHGRTVAILALDAHLSSPRSNTKLFNKIKQNGCVLSEFLADRKMTAGLFPLRNRIISGISRGTLIIEAGEKSGALITAKSALEQGRDIFAVPGSVFTQKSKGTNLLIQKGEAKLVMTASDILEEYFEDEGFEYSKENISNAKQKTVQDLTQTEKEIVSALEAGERSIDEIAFIIKKSVSETSKLITMMELAGLIRQRTDNRYENLDLK